MARPSRTRATAPNSSTQVSKADIANEDRPAQTGLSCYDAASARIADSPCAFERSAMGSGRTSLAYLSYWTAPTAEIASNLYRSC